MQSLECKQRTEQLQVRLRSLLAGLPSSTAMQQVGTALAKEGLVASARHDITALERVLQKARTLHTMLGTGMVGPQIGRPSRVAEPTAEERHEPSKPKTVHRTASGPGLPGWGRTRARKRVTYSGPREVPPPVYPWGPEPPVPAPPPRTPVRVRLYGGRCFEQYLALSHYLQELDDADWRANHHWVQNGPDDVGGWIPDLE